MQVPIAIARIPASCHGFLFRFGALLQTPTRWSRTCAGKYSSSMLGKLDQLHPLVMPCAFADATVGHLATHNGRIVIEITKSAMNWLDQWVGCIFCSDDREDIAMERFSMLFLVLVCRFIPSVSLWPEAWFTLRRPFLYEAIRGRQWSSDAGKSLQSLILVI